MLKIKLFATLLLTAILGFGTQAWSQTCSITPVNPPTQPVLVCQGTAITSLTFTSSGGTGAIFSGLPAGVTGSYNSVNGEITLSGTPSVAGTFNYFINLVGCSGSASASANGVMIVSPSSAGTLSGDQNICSVGGGSGLFANTSTTTFTSTVSGGTWSSSNALVATVNSSGVVTGVGAGTANITYTVTLSGGCSGNAIATRLVNVTSATNAGSISGTSTLCTGGSNLTSQMNSSVTGGIWSSSNAAVLTVNQSGLITAVGAGTANVIYTVSGTGGCGIDTALRSVTVTAFTAGVLSGSQSICSVGGGSSQSPNVNTTTFVSTVSGGTWSSSNTSVATVNSSGVVTGVAAGTADITYSLTFSSGGCSGSTATSTRTVTVTAAPEAGTLSGTQAICIGGGNSTTQFTVNGNSVSGVWSSTNTTVASVNSSGLVTAVGQGTANIVYTVSGSGGCGIATASRGVTVTLFTAGVLSGSQSICSVGGGSSQSPNVNTTTFVSTVSG
ncbi:MAG: beta strand repeat-containing protein, partial [Bacteroidota bacterium]